MRHTEVNVVGTFVVCREAARLLEASGGSMVLMASIRAHLVCSLSASYEKLPHRTLQADDLQEAYSASKAANIGLARSLAASLGPRGIRVCAFYHSRCMMLRTSLR